MKYKGRLLTGDFDENTITFQIEGDFILRAGKYNISKLHSDVSYIGDLHTGDFYENTMTFKIHHALSLLAGKYTIERIEEEMLPSNPKELICNWEIGEEYCNFKQKDPFTCKNIRNCVFCGN